MTSLPPTRELLARLKEIDRQEALFRLSRANRIFQDVMAFVMCVGAVTLYACLGLVLTGWVEKQTLRTFVLFVYDVMLVAFATWSAAYAVEGIWKGLKVMRRFTEIQANVIDNDEAVAHQFRAYIASATADDVDERKARIEQHLKEAKARGAFVGGVIALLTGLGSLKQFLSTPSTDNPFDLALIGAALGAGVSLGLAFWLFAEVRFGRLAFELERAAVAKRRQPANPVEPTARQLTSQPSQQKVKKQRRKVDAAS